MENPHLPCKLFLSVQTLCNHILIATSSISPLHLKSGVCFKPVRFFLCSVINSQEKSASMFSFFKGALSSYKACWGLWFFQRPLVRCGPRRPCPEGRRVRSLCSLLCHPSASQHGSTSFFSSSPSFYREGNQGHSTKCTGVREQGQPRIANLTPERVTDPVKDLYSSHLRDTHVERRGGGRGGTAGGGRSLRQSSAQERSPVT